MVRVRACLPVCVCVDDQAVLGCSSELTLHYLHQVEPYLRDPVAFPKVQVIPLQHMLI